MDSALELMGNETRGKKWETPFNVKFPMMILVAISVAGNGECIAVGGPSNDAIHGNEFEGKSRVRVFRWLELIV